MPDESDSRDRVLRNEDVARVVAEIPAGHRHLRTTVILADGSSLTFQEATIAALVRAYVAVKTDPLRTGAVLTGRRLAERKEGYAEWQLLEESDAGGDAAPDTRAGPPESAEA